MTIWTYLQQVLITLKLKYFAKYQSIYNWTLALETKWILLLVLKSTKYKMSSYCYQLHDTNKCRWYHHRCGEVDCAQHASKNITCFSKKIPWAWGYLHSWMKWMFFMFLRAWNSDDCAFENLSNGREIKCWNLNKYLFDTSITQVFWYGVVWGCWKEFSYEISMKWSYDSCGCSFLRPYHYPLRS